MTAATPPTQSVLAIDVGGTHVKFRTSEADDVRRFNSGPTLTAAQMCSQVASQTRDWDVDVVSIGYPGPVLHGMPLHDPRNLGGGWVGFDFAAALSHPVKLLNDAAMQALGSYAGGTMLFLGLGTGLGSAMIVDGIVEPMELAHLPYRKRTYEDYVGLRGLERLGKKKWRKHVEQVIDLLTAALEPDEVVLGGGNATLITPPPQHVRIGDNANAFTGGFRLWDDDVNARARTAA